MTGGQMALRRSLLDQGGSLGELVRESTPAEDGEGQDPAALAAEGPRTEGCRDEYRLLVETILEGSRLHYGPQRLVRTDDPDLALLAGDQLYALGLSRLAALGDLEAVVALADVIAEVAGAAAAGHPEEFNRIWARGAHSVGWAEPVPDRR